MVCSRSLRWDSAGLSCRCKGTSRKIAKLPPIWALYPLVVKDPKTWTVKSHQKTKTLVFSTRKMMISKPQQLEISHQHQLVQLRVQGTRGLISTYVKKSKKCLYITIRISTGAGKCRKGELPIFWQTKLTKKIKRDVLVSR